MPKICIYNGCTTRSNFNYKNINVSLFCSKHKFPNMINIRDKTCMYENCNTRPNFNYKDVKSPIYCKIHKLPNMINIKYNKRQKIN